MRRPPQPQPETGNLAETLAGIGFAIALMLAGFMS